VTGPGASHAAAGDKAAGVPPAPAASVFVPVAACRSCGDQFFPRHAGSVRCTPCVEGLIAQSDRAVIARLLRGQRA
jgi:hypothetical protein